jgi:hypothetical protein
MTGKVGNGSNRGVWSLLPERPLLAHPFRPANDGFAPDSGPSLVTPVGPETARSRRRPNIATGGKPPVASAMRPRWLTFTASCASGALLAYQHSSHARQNLVRGYHLRSRVMPEANRSS